MNVVTIYNRLNNDQLMVISIDVNKQHLKHTCGVAPIKVVMVAETGLPNNVQLIQVTTGFSELVQTGSDPTKIHNK